VPAAHRDRFTDDAWRLLVLARFVVSTQSNRMGYRLDGPVLGHVRGADMLSEAMPIGAIQVPASGQPILLMAERQTTGGYPTIANVITADLPIAGQLAPGDWITFDPVSHADAIVALRERESALAGETLSDPDLAVLLKRRSRRARAAKRAARTVHDLQGRRTRGLAGACARRGRGDGRAGRGAPPGSRHGAGGGSNVLVADAGVRGLVIRVHGGDVVAVDERTIRADAGLTINGLVRWTINAASPASSVGGDSGTVGERSTGTPSVAG
jgi:hypothetical protein